MNELHLANVVPSGDSVVEVDGKINSTCRNFTEALKAGLELKHKFPHMQVKVYDAKERNVENGVTRF